MFTKAQWIALPVKIAMRRSSVTVAQTARVCHMPKTAGIIDHRPVSELLSATGLHAGHGSSEVQMPGESSALGSEQRVDRPAS